LRSMNFGLMFKKENKQWLIYTYDSLAKEIITYVWDIKEI